MVVHHFWSSLLTIVKPFQPVATNCRLLQANDTSIDASNWQEASWPPMAGLSMQAFQVRYQIRRKQLDFGLRSQPIDVHQKPSEMMASPNSTLNLGQHRKVPLKFSSLINSHYEFTTIIATMINQPGCVIPIETGDVNQAPRVTGSCAGPLLRSAPWNRWTEKGRRRGSSPVGTPRHGIPTGWLM